MKVFITPLSKRAIDQCGGDGAYSAIFYSPEDKKEVSFVVKDLKDVHSLKKETLQKIIKAYKYAGIDMTLDDLNKAIQITEFKKRREIKKQYNIIPL